MKMLVGGLAAEKEKFSQELDRFEMARRTQEASLRTRQAALTEAQSYFRNRHQEATPEEVVSVAEKFEAYLTAPPSKFLDLFRYRTAFQSEPTQEDTR
jgi:hypothetical protein